MEVNLCNNCVNDTSCVYQSDNKNEAIVFCEIHELEQNFINTTKISESLKAGAVKDLCSDCDHKSTCALRDPEHFIFQCEHYI